MDIDFVKPLPLKKGLLIVEKLSLVYALLTSLLILALFKEVDAPIDMLMNRVIIVGITLGLTIITAWWPSKLMILLRVGFQMGLLSYWYPETYEFNRSFENLDNIFAGIEQGVFGLQPSLLFHTALPQSWMSEAFYLGYFSYYPMIGVVTLGYFLTKFQEFDKVSSIIVGSFFIYYILYILIPVVGPQFYFPVIGWDSAIHGVFPAIGDYFNNHAVVVGEGPGYHNGLFYNLVKSSQEVGERPTAAFPSSHVGISTILLFLASKLNKKLLYFLLPFYALLCGATVYIQAHYVIDVVGGWLSAILIYYLVVWVYDRFMKQHELYKV